MLFRSPKPQTPNPTIKNNLLIIKIMNESRLMTLCFSKIKDRQKMIRSTSVILITYGILEIIVMSYLIQVKHFNGLPAKEIKNLAIFSIISKLLVIIIPLSCLRYFKSQTITNSFLKEIRFKKLKNVFLLIAILMCLEMLVLFVFSFYIMKSISQKIREDEMEHTFHTVVAKTIFLAAITLIFALQIFRVFFYSFSLKMAILFTRIWNENLFKKKSLNDLNQSTIVREREKYVDTETQNVRSGRRSVCCNFFRG